MDNPCARRGACGARQKELKRMGPKGERTTLPRSGSGGRSTARGSISTRGEDVTGEHARADSFALAGHAEGLRKDYGNVLVITDNLSAHASRDAKNSLRRLHRKYTGENTLKDPAGRIAVPERCRGARNMLKPLLPALCRYRTFDGTRRELADLAGRTRTVELDAVEYLFRDPVLYAIA